MHQSPARPCGSSLLPQARREARLRLSPAGVEGMAGVVEVDDDRCVIRGNGLPFRASRSISAQTTRSRKRCQEPFCVSRRVGKRRSSNQLLLEEIVQGATRVVRAPWSRRRFSLHRGAEGKEGAVIASALVGDTLRDGLRALKPLAWGEVGALLAGMQLCSALGTVAEPVGQGGEECATVGATEDGAAWKHPGRTRSRRSLAPSSPLLFGFAIPSLAIFSICHGDRPQVSL